MIRRRIFVANSQGYALEEKNPPKDILYNAGQVLGRVLGLSGCNGNGLGATI